MTLQDDAQLALAEAQYDLAAELLRFVVPPTDSEDAFSALPAASGSGIRSHGASELGSKVAPQRVRMSPIFAQGHP